MFTTEYERLYNRFLGALVGVAVGDALGATVEFMPAGSIAAAYGGTLTEIIGGGWLHLRAGEVTDDTQMTMAVARGIVRSSIVGAEHVAECIGKEFIDWIDTNPKDVGATCARSIRNAKNLIAAGWDAKMAWTAASKCTHSVFRFRLV